VKFTFTPEEAQPVARAVARHYRARGCKIAVERAPWRDAPFKPTLVATQAGNTILVEARGELSFGKALKEFNAWLANRRLYAELYVAAGEESEGAAGVIADLQSEGVGLLIVRQDGHVEVSRQAQNPALIVTPDPTLSYGHCKKDVANAIQKFNKVDRKDGLRDTCELVERETENLALKAARKGILSVPEAAIRAKDWSGQIDTLASPNTHAPGRSPLLTAALRNDFHSFRGARNLVDHPARGKREEKRRQIQFHERMAQGPRLIAELITFQRRVR